MLRYSIYVFLLVLCSCSNSDDDRPTFDINSFPQHWELTGVSSGLSGDFLEGDDLPLMETLVLGKDRQFSKTRLTNDEENKGKGSFDFTEINGEMYLILNYDTETDMIESCGNEKQIETLFMPSINSLVGGSAPCDGPGLFYERIE